MPKAKAEEGQIKVRVLTQCTYGVANDVVVLSEADAKQGAIDGVVDATPEAVAYAESLVAEA